METDLQKLIAAKKARAKQLGVDKFVWELYDDFGLKYDPAKATSGWHFPQISEWSSVAGQTGQSVFAMVTGGINYQFIKESKTSYVTYDQYDVLTVRVDDKDVFQQHISITVDEISTWYKAGLVTAFIEGPWIEPLRELYRYGKERQNRHRDELNKRMLAQEAERFGINVTEAENPVTEASMSPDIIASQSQENKTYFAPGMSHPDTPKRAWVYTGIAATLAVLSIIYMTFYYYGQHPGNIAGTLGAFVGVTFVRLVVPYAIAIWMSNKNGLHDWLRFSKWLFWMVMLVLFALQKVPDFGTN